MFSVRHISHDMVEVDICQMCSMYINYEDAGVSQNFKIKLQG